MLTYISWAPHTLFGPPSLLRLVLYTCRSGCWMDRPGSVPGMLRNVPWGVLGTCSTCLLACPNFGSTVRKQCNLGKETSRPNSSPTTARLEDHENARKRVTKRGENRRAGKVDVIIDIGMGKQPGTVHVCTYCRLLLQRLPSKCTAAKKWSTDE